MRLGAKETYNSISNEIDPVSIVKSNLVSARVPDRTFVWVGGQLQNIAAFPEVVKSATILSWYWAQGAPVVLILRRKVPFADVVCRVAGLTKTVGQRFRLRSKANAVVPDSIDGRVSSGEQAGARRPADGLIGDGIGEIHSRLHQAVEVGREIQRVQPISADAIPAELVGDENDDIGWRLIPARLHRAQQWASGAESGRFLQKITPVD